MNSSLHLHTSATVLIAAAVAVTAVHIAGNSHGQHYVTDSSLNVYIRRTLSPGLYPQLKDVLCWHHFIFGAVGFMPPPSAGTTRSSTTRSKSQSIAPAAYAVRAFSRTNSDDECMEQWLAGLNNRSLQQRPTSKGPYPRGPGPIFPTPRPPAAADETPSDAIRGFLAHREVHALCHLTFPTSETDHQGFNLSPNLTAYNHSSQGARRQNPQRHHHHHGGDRQLACPIQNAAVLLQAQSSSGLSSPLLTFSLARSKAITCSRPFRRRLTLIGLPALRITSHSSRHDAAQHADEAGFVPRTDSNARPWVVERCRS
ncbi:hypothetical protein E4U52_007763 [Claviceps spartinae]|nr:hypothetical protein E4U52_007763 [Claviceps spartinae]